MKEIIVRADDLGFSQGINYGIERSCRDGIIRSVGIMVNMPYTKHGYNLVKDLPLCFGLHTNICVGKPLSDPNKIKSICDENGNLKSSKIYRESFKNGIDFVDLDEVIIEIEAQYEAFVELVGEKPHYFEGHAVASDNFFKGLQIVAQRHGCDYLGMNMNGPVKFKNSLLYSSMESNKPDYDPFESLKNAAQKDYGDNGYLMFVCHPGYLDQYILDVSSLILPRPKEVEMLSSQSTKDWLKENNIKVITYDEIK